MCIYLHVHRSTCASIYTPIQSIHPYNVSTCPSIHTPIQQALRKSLVNLDVSNNNLHTLPAGAKLEAMASLAALNLENNALTFLDPALGKLELRALLVSGNPLKLIPRAVQQGGTERLLALLRDRIPANPAPLPACCAPTSSAPAHHPDSSGASVDGEFEKEGEKDDDGGGDTRASGFSPRNGGMAMAGVPRASAPRGSLSSSTARQVLNNSSPDTHDTCPAFSRDADKGNSSSAGRVDSQAVAG